VKNVRGLDIGCGANFIYPLLGAAIYGWKMVGCDVTDVAIQWSRRHIASNPDLAFLLEVSKCNLFSAYSTICP
jgi:23S rRNA (adenine1618-N6)-methyltransferase